MNRKTKESSGPHTLVEDAVENTGKKLLEH